ncbi:thermonuclease family protein [Alkalihalobacillus deserti]|uniref:thermonuclease family protein n=1 Tax=Alkalihalobacillus deserti TaxID=2879466 RepID=UPI001D136CAD|nr:thermonuclease family protein [Alkalihalobacillus deserti]
MRLKYIFVLLLVLMSACAPAENKLPDSIEIDEENQVYLEGEWIVAKVDRVIDGDTIVISQLNLQHVENQQVVKKLSDQDTAVTVRFLAIDTPENTQTKQVYGKESTELVKQLLEGKEVIIEIDPLATFDKYDRLLGHAFTVEGANIQQLLLRNGLARVAYLYDDYQYVDDFLAAEKKARTEQLSIHSIEGYVTERGFNMDAVN